LALDQSALPQSRATSSRIAHHAAWAARGRMKMTRMTRMIRKARSIALELGRAFEDQQCGGVSQDLPALPPP
jgi:hypothetical protein